jgi:hypothetical protein
LNAKFGNLKDQIEKWSFPVQNDTVSNMDCSSSSSLDAESPSTKKERKHPSPTTTQIANLIFMKITILER